MSNKEKGKVEKNKGGDTIESHPETLDRVPSTPPVESANELEQRLKETKEKDLALRLSQFNNEIKPLLSKYHFELAAEPYIENGQIKAKPTVNDVKA